MAEVQEQATHEPSMEEILASIRKIISDEQDPAAPGAGDVIELTQAVQQDGTVVDVKVAAETPPPPPAEVAPPPSSAPEPVAVQPEPTSAPVAPASPTPELVSEPAASVSASSLSSLATTVEIERLAAEPHTFTMFGNGARTLEDMVIELMRPLLKQWLDANLPNTVERLVQKEIERISRRADKE